VGAGREEKAMDENRGPETGGCIVVMKKTKWSQKDVQFILDNYKTMDNFELADALSKTYGQVKTKVSNMKLNRGKEWKRKCQAKWNAKSKNCFNWTPERLEYLKENINLIPSKQIAKMFGCSETVIRLKCKNANIHPTPDALKTFIEDSRFSIGHIPANKGKKGISPPGSVATQFKKGSVPKNTLHDGAITVRKNHKKGIQIKYIRISPGNWLELKNYLWVQHHGPIPKQHVVRFKNGKTMDVRIENLECISKAENARRNRNLDADTCIASFISRDPEVKKELLKRPEILDLKREQLKLRRSINEHSVRKTG
jgi:HNH endonuclease